MFSIKNILDLYCLIYYLFDPFKQLKFIITYMTYMFKFFNYCAKIYKSIL